MASLFNSSRNLSYYAIPAAWFIAVVPHAYAITLYSARSSSPSTAVDLTKPRVMLKTLDEDQSVDKATKDAIIRAESAHGNGMENLGLFAAAVVAGNTAGVEAGLLNALSWGYVGSRVLYNLVYINNTTRALATILDITSEVARDYWEELQSDDDNVDGQERTQSLPVQTPAAESIGSSESLGSDAGPSPSSSAVAVSPLIKDGSITFQKPLDYRDGRGKNIVAGSETSASFYSDTLLSSTISALGTEHERLVVDSSSPISYLNDESAAAHLLSLRKDACLDSPLSGAQACLQPKTPERASTTAVPSLSSMLSPADRFSDDGIFLQGSAYWELHATLRDHMFSTAKSNVASSAATRQPSPNLDHSSEDLQMSLVDDYSRNSRYGSKGSELLAKHVEYELWKNWIDEVAPWLDKFDLQCHFGHKLPALAKTHPHLRYSILALSARQMERKDRSRPSSGSLALYQEAIHLLLPNLQQKHTAVIASCLVLCVLEMMSCSPREWRRHLDGAASLLGAIGINGFAGGINQALFWVFARMDSCGSFISSEGTLIPITNWVSQPSLAADIHLFQRTATRIDAYANYAVYLSGRVIDLLYNRNYSQEFPGTRSGIDAIHDRISFTRRWSELFEYIEDWYADRTEEMKPVHYVPASEDDNSRPFPTLLFGNPPAISGNQLYHTAALLMLQRRPPRAKCSRKPRSVLWHARRICAISISNTHHGCWTNSIQPLWLAGQVMSHPAEHRAILELYERIERETGFGAKWRAQDLKELWGDLD
ncbi:MAG: hypothetical protein M1821_005760 [Bathelium mastoideum]|nr:MAG: hypothetical protein M1821_005760 [Bathelium mastoideum]